MLFNRLASIARRSMLHLSTYFFLILLIDLPFLHLQASLGQKTAEDEDIFEEIDTNPEHRAANPKIKDTGRRVPPGRTGSNGDDLDNDEFIGAEQGGNKAQPSKDKISFGPMEKQNYYPEIGAILFLVIYGINFLIGRRTNDQIADAWIKAYRNLFELQFASVGFSDSSQGSSNQGLLKESPSSFKYYATGRRYCHCILATLELRKRHDLFSLLLAAVDLSTTTDTLNLEIPMNDVDMEPFVFAIVRRKHERKIRKATKDLENYSGLIKNSRLPANLCLLTDCPELDREFLDEAVISVLKEKEDLFVSLHFTDQNTSPPFYLGGTGNKKMLKFRFNLPKTINEMEDLKPLVKMALHFIDRVAAKRLSTQARTKAIQQRKIVAEKLFRASHAQRQEALTKRKEDLRKKEEEGAAELSPEALRRREAREHKAALKKKQPKVKIMR